MRRVVNVPKCLFLSPGCVLKLKWNLELRSMTGQSKTPPEHYMPYLREKRVELLKSLFGSAAVAAVLMNGLAFAQGDFGSDVAMETMVSALWVIAISVGLSILT